MGKTQSPRALLGAVENDVFATDSQEFPQKFRTTHKGPSKSAPGCLSWKRKQGHVHVHGSVIHNSQEGEPLKRLSVGERVDRMWWVRVQYGISCVHVTAPGGPAIW